MNLHRLRVHDLRIKFAHRAQALGLPAVARVQRLTEDVLPARGVIANVEPVAGVIERVRDGTRGLP